MQASQVDSSAATDALETLCRAYWFPLYAYVRSRGHELQDAQDLTQEFFARFLGGNYLGDADQSKGRFRSFLLGSLKHFLANEWDRSRAIKRGGQCTFLSWEDLPDDSAFQADSAAASGDTVYDRQWTLTSLDKVFAALRDECAGAGKRDLFQALQGYLSGERSQSDETSYATVGEQLGMSAGAVQVAVHRLRKRYGELLRTEIAHTVSQPREVDEELRQLFAALRG